MKKYLNLTLFTTLLSSSSYAAPKLISELGDYDYSKEEIENQLDGQGLGYIGLRDSFLKTSYKKIF